MSAQILTTSSLNTSWLHNVATCVPQKCDVCLKMWWQKSSSTYPTKASYAAAHGRTVTYCDIVISTHLSRLRGDDKHLSPCIQPLPFPLSAANLYINLLIPLPSHPKTFPSRLTLAAHHPISQPRHHHKATSNTKHLKEQVLSASKIRELVL